MHVLCCMSTIYHISQFAINLLCSIQPLCCPSDPSILSNLKFSRLKALQDYMMCNYSCLNGLFCTQNTHSVLNNFSGLLCQPHFYSDAQPVVIHAVIYMYYFKAPKRKHSCLLDFEIHLFLVHFSQNGPQFQGLSCWAEPQTAALLHPWIIPNQTHPEGPKVSPPAERALLSHRSRQWGTLPFGW